MYVEQLEVEQYCLEGSRPKSINFDNATRDE